LQPGFWPSLAGSHRVFSSPVFSSTQPGFSLWSTRRAGLDFKTMLKTKKSPDPVGFQFHKTKINSSNSTKFNPIKNIKDINRNLIKP
jgi:hypothetical protein